MVDLNFEMDESTAGMAIGVLAIGNTGGTDGSRLRHEKQAFEEMLREKYRFLARAELKSLHPMDTYITYYKKFGYTYHVLPQLESILRSKDIPDVLPPVTAMFMAELKNLLLTAGHDFDKVVMPLRLMRSTGNETIPALSGKDVMTVPGDYMITDRKGVISAVLRGCDARTAISEETKNVIYTAYAPPGVDDGLVRRHLEDIEAYVKIFSDAPVTLIKNIFKT